METSDAVNTAVSSDSMHFLQLDPLCLKHVFHLVAMDHEVGIASTAALSQTCKYINEQNDELLNCYKFKKSTLSRGKWHEGTVFAESADHPFWLWLSKRQGRISRLTVHIKPFAEVPHDSIDSCEEELEWIGPLKLLSTIPGLHLKVHMPRISSLEHPFARFCLQNEVDLMQGLKAEYSKTYEEVWLPMAGFVQIAGHFKSLVLNKIATSIGSPELFEGFEALSNLTQLTSLSINDYFLYQYVTERKDLWQALATLTRLQHLDCNSIVCDIDPSPLSALTALTSLQLDSKQLDVQHPLYGLYGAQYFSFSSLQPLSTLQQLEVLDLQGCSCTATSLQGLGALPRLKDVDLRCERLVTLQGVGPVVSSPLAKDADHAGLIVTPALESLHIWGAQITSLSGLEGLSNCLFSLTLVYRPKLSSLSGVEGISTLHKLLVSSCGLTSLQPLATFGRKQKEPETIEIGIDNCGKVEEEVLELPYVPAAASVVILDSNVKEVVVAGGAEAALQCLKRHL
jgi:hypothetical protein